MIFGRKNYKKYIKIWKKTRQNIGLSLFLAKTFLMGKLGFFGILN